jgi:cyclophilin family peptidyl-prolyl cis-trans isomerase
MRLSQRLRRRANVHKAFDCKCMIDELETRRLLSESAVGSITPVLASTSSPASNNIALNQYFNDSLIPGTLVTFTTTEGTIYVALTDQATPKTVANFLYYVDNGSYTDTFFHRSSNLNTGLGANSSNPATIIQAGGYNLGGGSISQIPTQAPVADEFQSEVLGDTADTLAMAKTSYADSATSQFYFNVSDNTELDNPTTDPNGTTTSYTVFGQVLSVNNGESITTINTIAALPTDGYLGGDLTDVPVTGVTDAQAAANAAFTASDLVFIEGVTAQPGTTYTATSDNKALVDPTVTNGVLSFAYGSGSGTADITITATNLDGTSATNTVAVTVPNSATPSAGPVANAVTAPAVVTGTTGTFSVLATDTDSLSALNPADVTIVTEPAHGNATVNPTTGYISYTPDAGYIGADTLTYTAADDIGNVSAPATVTLNAVPTSVAVTIGVGQKATSLTFTQPDGVTGHLTLADASAVITFSSYQVTTKIVNGVMIASGAGTTITNINVTNTSNAYSKLTVSSNGPVSLGSVDDNAVMGLLKAPDGTLTGTSNFHVVGALEVAAALDATINLGSGLPSNLSITNVTNTSVFGNEIESINSKQWLNTDGGTYNISAQSISVIKVTGTFADNISLGSTRYSIIEATIGQATGAWELSGSLYKASFGTPGSNWSLQSDGLVGKLAIKGNLANSITAAAITSLTVAGTTTDATIETDAAFSAKYKQIGSIHFGGAVSNTVIFASGNIGAITAPSFTNSRMYAGVELTVAQNGELAASTSDLSADATITSLSLGNKANSFANSLISADIIGSLHLGDINTSNSGTPEGVSAHSIGSISGALVPGGKLAAGKAQLKSAAALSAYETAKKLSLGDFEINLF